ncbi:reverse transcriptase domain-containing protein [Tanacetum coccineum]|uniref:Reverse transcriptase domain-containing protein n=1 Tax=Tanacetum coccineum TaxID=301880 RepID=A0ABQ5E1T5_9ASTR
METSIFAKVLTKLSTRTTHLPVLRASMDNSGLLIGAGICGLAQHLHFTKRASKVSYFQRHGKSDWETFARADSYREIWKESVALRHSSTLELMKLIEDTIQILMAKIESIVQSMNDNLSAEVQRRQKSNTDEDDLYRPWTCEERNPFTPRIRHFSLPRTRMPSHVKTYDGSGDPEDHLKLFQSAAINQKGLGKMPKHEPAFRENSLQQTKHSRIQWSSSPQGKEMEESTEELHGKNIRQKSWTLERSSGNAWEVAALSPLTGQEKHHMENLQREGTANFKKGSKINKDGSWQSLGIPKVLSESAMSFPPLREEEGTEGPMIIQSRNGRTTLCIGLLRFDGGASSEVMKYTPPYALDEINGLSAHGMLKFLVEGGTVTLQSSRVIPMECAMISGPSTQPLAMNQKKDVKELCSLLKQNLDIFAWKPADMTGVPRSIAEHRLNIREGYSPVRQKKRGQAPERNKAIQEEVEKLVDARIMKDVLHYQVGFLLRRGPQLAISEMHQGRAEAKWKISKFKQILVKISRKIVTFFQNLEKLHKKSDFQWTPEAEEAFKQMKKLIAELPTLTAPREREELIIYLAAAKEAISAVLMTDREGRQIPVYFVSRTLRGPEVNYTPMEKLVLALLSASKRLKRYFQAHTVVVITNQPIKQLLSSSEISGRMLKWKFELEGYDIQYRPRTAIKGQILADFIVERPEEESPDELMAEPEVLPEPWTLFTDGSSCVDGSGAGLILTNPEGAEFTYAMRFRFEATNNEAEYEALIAGLRIAEKMGIKNLQANVDSRLVANQVNGSYIAKESGMVQYLNKVKTLAKSFKEFSIKQIPRSENKKADALSKIASTSFAHLNKQVLVEELQEKSINEEEILDIVEEEGNTWMTPIQEYLTKEILPEDKKKARAVRRKAAKYAMINGTLYKKSFLGPWLRCVGAVFKKLHTKVFDKK